MIEFLIAGFGNAGTLPEFGELPGPATIASGTSAYGYYGLTDGVDMMTTTNLRTLTGLDTTGTTLNENPNWLKYSLDDVVVYMAMKPLIYNISWSQLNAQGLVTGKEITWNGLRFKIRLIKGAASDPTTSTQANPPATAEWNNLMFPVHTTHPNGAATWASYTDAQLGVNLSANGGSGGNTDWYATWCQETNNANSGQAVHRGYQAVTHFNFNTKTTAGTAMVWRPVLEYLGKVA